MSFDSPAAFAAQTTAGPKAGPQTQRILKAGSILYRADHAGSTIASREVPVFLSDKESIKVQARGNPNALSKQTLTTDVKLFELSLPNISAMIRDSRVPTEIKEFIAGTQLGMADATPEIWERLRSQGQRGRGTPARLAYVVPALPVAPGVQSNRIFSTIVCQLGFDGWVAMPGELIQRNVDLAQQASRMAEIATDMQAGTVHQKQNAQNPEVVLCDWSRHATAALGGRRKTRRNK